MVNCSIKYFAFLWMSQNTEGDHNLIKYLLEIVKQISDDTNTLSNKMDRRLDKLEDTIKSSET